MTNSFAQLKPEMKQKRRRASHCPTVAYQHLSFKLDQLRKLHCYQKKNGNFTMHKWHPNSTALGASSSYMAPLKNHCAGDRFNAAHVMFVSYETSNSRQESSTKTHIGPYLVFCLSFSSVFGFALHLLPFQWTKEQKDGESLW